MADPRWTFDEAWAAQEAFEVANPGVARGPFYQWLAIVELELLQEKHRTGRDPGVVLHAIYVCLLDGLPVPQWAANAFRRSYIDGVHGKLATWDNVFGKPQTEGKYRRGTRDKIYPAKIWDMVREAKSNGVPVDDHLFRKIGKELAIGSRTIVKRLYASRCKLVGKPTG